MDRRWLGLALLPLLLAGLVFWLAPPVSLTTEADRAKARRMEEMRLKPEPIPIPPDVAKASRRDEASRPALPRTPEELNQVKALLKSREESLLQRKSRLAPYDQNGRTALYNDIVVYNEDLQAYEALAEALRK
ncbi:MAG: hypothetical protein JSR82_00055 [Verrucomicrobia bacterium]|nr:hypothetical protein [Verrucomicrobiota bacterium]